MATYSFVDSQQGRANVRRDADYSCGPGGATTSTTKRKFEQIRATSPRHAPGRVTLPQYKIPQHFPVSQEINPTSVSPASRSHDCLAESLDNNPRRQATRRVVSASFLNSSPKPVVPTYPKPPSSGQTSPVHPTVPNRQPSQPLDLHADQSLRKDQSPGGGSGERTTPKVLDVDFDRFLLMSPNEYFPAPTSTVKWDSFSGPPFFSHMTETENYPTPNNTSKAAIMNIPTPEEYQPPILQQERQTVGATSSSDARLAYVLNASSEAGFESMDDAILCYYRQSFENSDALRQRQKLNRMRKLPVLLRELCLAAQTWTPLQRRGFQEQLIRGAEDILVVELEEHLASKQARDHLRNAQGVPRPTEEKIDIETELPNIWTLLTALSTRHRSVASSRDMHADLQKLFSDILSSDMG